MVGIRTVDSGGPVFYADVFGGNKYQFNADLLAVKNLTWSGYPNLTLWPSISKVNLNWRFGPLIVCGTNVSEQTEFEDKKQLCWNSFLWMVLFKIERSGLIRFAVLGTKRSLKIASCAKFFLCPCSLAETGDPNTKLHKKDVPLCVTSFIFPEIPFKFHPWKCLIVCFCIWLTHLASQSCRIPP